MSLLIITGCKDNKSTDKEESNRNVKTMESYKIKIDNEEKELVLYDNETSSEFIKLLPMTLEMHELNGNEKFYYLDNELPKKDELVKTIKSGDVMLYDGSCIVIFYEDFETNYSYTKIGYIKDATNLKELVGTKNTYVTFSK